jgi:autoinducer 2 (AI-2) kinase
MATMDRDRQETVLVLDAGTGSGRASLVAADGRIVAQAARPWEMPVARDGSQDLAVEAMAALLDDAVVEVVSSRRAAGIRAVAATSVRGAFVLLDRTGTVLTAFGSSDARARDEVRAMLPAEPAFHAATGQKVALAALPRLRWLANDRPSVADRVTRLLTIDAWLGGRMDGSESRASVSNASTTGLLDLASRTWSSIADTAWAQPGDERFAAWLPPLAEGGEVAGDVSDVMSRRLGVPAGIPVVAGGGDAQGAATGLGCLETGDAAIIMGSHWQSVVTLERPMPDARARYRTIAHVAAGRWQADAIAWSAGLFVDWFVRAFATEGASATDGSGTDASDAHARLGSEASSLPPGAGGILAVGGLPLTGADWAHAAPSLLGFSLADATHARPAAYRAIVEAGCLTVAANLEVIASGMGPALGDEVEIRIGGGASRSDLVCQVLADVTGRTVARSATPQAATVGAAACAAVAAGWYADVSMAARAMARIDRRFEPNAGHHDAYVELAARWRTAAAAQRALADDAITTPVWKPAS